MRRVNLDVNQDVNRDVFAQSSGIVGVNGAPGETGRESGCESGRFCSVVRKSSFDHPGIRASGHSVIRASGLSASGVVEVFLGVRSSVKRVGACSREKGRGQQNPFQ